MKFLVIVVQLMFLLNKSLVKAYCLPVLTYCIGALNLPVATIKDLGQGLVYAGMTVFANYLDTNVLNQLNRCNIFVVNYHLI